ncbi:hypothetical protein ACH347_25480 [Saccharopolyspora sp. 5N102]|uniref:hypothetical protein n=1 Tax=Saccharopolyspora sp. 5N102 TaxID=3375155 RepID=UPI0037B45F4C
MHAKPRSVEIPLPRTGDQLNLVVEDQGDESCVIACVGSDRDGKCEPCEFDPDEARHVAQTLLDLLRSMEGTATIAVPRPSDRRLILVVEHAGGESYLTACLGNKSSDGSYDACEFNPEEVRLAARALRELADVADEMRNRA